MCESSLKSLIPVKRGMKPSIYFPKTSTFLRLSSWCGDKKPPRFYDAETTRRGVANGMETSWLPTGQEALPPASALSVGPFCLLGGHAPLPIPVMCSSLQVPATHDSADEFGQVRVLAAGKGKTATFVPGCTQGSSSVVHVDPFVSFSGLACVFMRSRRKSRAVSQRVGVFALGRGF